MNYMTPKEIMDMVSSAFPRSLVKVRGMILLEGSYYKLSDGEVKVDLLDLEGEIPEGTEVEVDGFLTYGAYMQGGGVFAKIRVKDIKVLNESGASGNKMLSLLEEKLRKKTHRGFWGSYIQGLMEKDGVLQVAVLHGKGSQVHRDFEQALTSNAGKYRSLVELSFHETSLSDDQLSQALLEVKDYPMVFLLRGGGAKEELQRVGGFQSAMVVLENHIPLYLALGHSLDKNLSFMEKVAEYTFATPSIAGAELGKALRQTAEFLSLNKEKQELLGKVKLVDELRNALEQRDQQIKELQKKRVETKINPVSIFFALLAGTVIGFILSTILR